MKTIIHTCSSALLRPNGITRYINAAIDSRKLVNQLFITDSKPTQTISPRAATIWQSATTLYAPNFRDGVPDLQLDWAVVDAIAELLKIQIQRDHWQRIITHCALSTMAALRVVPRHRHRDIIFIQHESDIMNYPQRWSYLSLSWLEQQQQLITQENITVGLPIMNTNSLLDRIPHKLYTPPPFVPQQPEGVEKVYDCVYIGDATVRKNAREFVQICREHNLKGLAITHDPDAELFHGVDTRSFLLDQQRELYLSIESARTAYIASLNECMPLVMLECLQFVPTVVNAARPWTQHVGDCGAIITNTPELTIKQLQNHSYDPTQFHKWCGKAQKIWQNI